MEYEFSVKIEASPRMVWTTLTDVEHWPRWTRSMTQVQRLDDGPLSVGSKARVHQPKMRPLVWTVTEVESDRSFTWAAGTAGVRLVAGHDLTPGPEGVSARLSVRVTGWLVPLITPFIAPRIRRYLRMEGEGLKQRAEGGDHAAGGC